MTEEVAVLETSFLEEFLVQEKQQIKVEKEEDELQQLLISHMLFNRRMWLILHQLHQLHLWF
jgi:hypothetical protein